MRWHKNNLLAFVLDLALVAFGWWLTFWLRFNLDIPDEFQAMMVDTLPWPLLGFGTSLLVWGVYRHIWRYTSVAELTRLVYGVVFAYTDAADINNVPYDISINGTATLHGALVANYKLGNSNGSYNAVYDAEALKNLPNTVKSITATVPGSWQDLGGEYE